MPVLLMSPTSRTTFCRRHYFCRHPATHVTSSYKDRLTIRHDTVTDTKCGLRLFDRFAKALSELGYVLVEELTGRS